MTLLLAVWLFGEHLQPRLVLAAGAVFAGAAFVMISVLTSSHFPDGRFAVYALVVGAVGTG